MASWQKSNSIKVSICCITYKQDKYITDALDSFLIQKTTFPFEIIIGEDCGGDDTLAILAEYQACYPNLIKVVTAENNVGANANFIRIFNAAKGEYIAICEGDDYWVDELKIQKQYDSLKILPDVNICFTAAKTISSQGELGLIARHSREKKIISLSNVVRGGGGFMPTASIMFRKDNVVDNIPGWFQSAPIGDFYIQVIGSIMGGALFLPDISVVYRVNSIGSWSSSESTLKAEVSLKQSLQKLEKYLHIIDQLENLSLDKKDIAFLRAVSKIDMAKLLIVSNVNDCDLEKLKINLSSLISSSWKEEKNVNRLQVFIYRLRFSYYVLRYSFKLIESFKRPFLRR